MKALPRYTILEALNYGPLFNRHLVLPAGYDPVRELEAAGEAWYREQDEAYEEAHRCNWCTVGYCPHCEC